MKQPFKHWGKKPILWLLLLLAAANIAITPANAQVNCPTVEPQLLQTSTVWQTIGKLSLVGCFRADSKWDLIPGTDRYLAIKFESDKPLKQLVVEVRDGLTGLAEQIEVKAATSTGQAKIFYQRMARAIRASIDQTAAGITSRTYGRQRWELSTAGKIQLVFGQGVDLQSYISNSCDADKLQDPLCRSAYQEAKAILRYADLVGHVLGQWFADKVEKTKERVRRISSQWDQFRREARSMYVWELAANELVHRKQSEKGFPSPPNWQLILMHPSAGLEYAPGSGDKVTPVITLEVLGANRWKWGGPEGEGVMGMALGGSIVMTFSDRAGFKTISYGGIVHIDNKFSIGATRGRGPAGKEWRVLFSLDLLKLVQEESKGSKGLLSKFSIPDDWPK